MIGKVNDAYQAVKNGLEVEIALATAEQKILLVDAKEALVELKDMVVDLREENSSLKAKLANKENVYFADGAYWQKTDSAKTRPYCSRCFEKDGLLISINKGFYPPACPECNNALA